jgi:H+/Cl- antiporter ClcA
MNSETGKFIIGAGILVVLIGLIIYFFHDKLNWIGRLPGDIRIEKENFRFYFPIVTMILLSVIVSFLIWLIRRFF